MNSDKSKTILAVGAHVGDMELTAGGLLATCAQKGWDVVVVSMTSSEKSARADEDLEAVKAIKVQEAAAFTDALGGKSIVRDTPDGLLEVTDELSFWMCDLIRQLTPEIVVTHYPSPHKDHMACHSIVENARFYASLAAIQRVEAAFTVPKVYFTENWEDNLDFKKELYLDTSEGYALWQSALKKETSVMNCPFMPIVEYYTLKSRLNGIIAGTQHAECYMRPESMRVVEAI